MIVVSTEGIEKHKRLIQGSEIYLAPFFCYNHNMSFFKTTRNWYGRFEHPISSLSLIAGFVFDILTLKRVDTLWENFWIVAHLVIVGVFIALIHLKRNEVGDEKNPSKAHFWFVNILQFFFLFSYAFLLCFSFIFFKFSLFSTFL